MNPLHNENTNFTNLTSQSIQVLKEAMIYKSNLPWFSYFAAAL